MLKKCGWLFLFVIALAAAAATSSLWLKPLLNFIKVESSRIQALADGIQIVLWIVAGIIMLVAAIRRRNKPAEAKEHITKTEKRNIEVEGNVRDSVLVTGDKAKVVQAKTYIKIQVVNGRSGTGEAALRKAYLNRLFSACRGGSLPEKCEELYADTMNLLKYSAMLLCLWLSFLSPTLAQQQWRAPRVAEQRAKFEHNHPVPSFSSQAFGKTALPDFRKKRIYQLQRFPADRRWCEPGCPAWQFSGWDRPKSPHALQRLSNVSSADSLQVAWVRDYASQQAPGWDEAHDVAVDAAGNIYVAGYSSRLPNGVDALLIKYDPNGNELWVARYDAGADEIAHSIVLDTGGNIVIGGTTQSVSGDIDYLVLKYSPAGALLWATQTGGAESAADHFFAMVLDTAGHIYATGSTGGYPADYLTVKYSPDGGEMWMARYNGPASADDHARDIAIDPGGNIYVTGQSEGLETYEDFATIKYDADGRQQWVRRYDGPANQNDYVAGIAIDASSNVLIAGTVLDSTYSSDFATIKYSPAGEELWIAKYDSPTHDWDSARAIACDTLGNVYVTGESCEFGLTTIKYDSSGSEQWAEIFSEPGLWFNSPQSMLIDASGNIYITGSGQTDAERDYAIVKYSPQGQQFWAQRYDGPANYYDEAYAIAVDAVGNAIITGSSSGSENGIDDHDMATVKYSANGIERWVARYNGPGNTQDRAKTIIGDAAGNVYIAGDSEQRGSEEDILLIKYDPTGKEIWNSIYDGPGHGSDYIADMEIDRAGNIYLAGSSYDRQYDTDWTTLKLNRDGQVLWASHFSSIEDYQAFPEDLALDLDGNVYVAGNAHFETDGGPADFVLAKYDNDGFEKWHQRIESPDYGNQQITALSVDDRGKIYLLYPTYSEANSGGFAVAKFNSEGEQEWLARFDGANGVYEWPTAIALDHSGNAYITGRQYDPKVRQQQWMMTAKFSAGGEKLWDRTFKAPGAERTFPESIAVARLGDVIVAGGGFSPGQGTDYFVIEYDAKGEEKWLVYDREKANGYSSLRGLRLDGYGNIYTYGMLDAIHNRGHFISKFSKNGEWLWQHSMDGSGIEKLWIDLAGDIYAGGSTSGFLWSKFTLAKYTQGENGLASPATFTLAQNYPNPFNYATTIRYAVPADTHVSLKIYNIQGQEIATLADGPHIAGWHQATWGGNDVPSGLYFYRLHSGDFVEAKKLVLVK